MTTIRTLYAPDSYLSRVKGIGAYTYSDSNRTFEKATPISVGTSAVLFYEVSIVDGEGSWWAPTAPQSLRHQDWPNPVVPISGSGDGVWTTLFGEDVVRPENFYWWIPESVLSQIPIRPAINQGSLSGNFPITQPLVSA